MKRIVLPDALHEELRREASRKRGSLAKVIRTRLEGRERLRRARRQPVDPLRRVEGIGSDGKLAHGIDEALYGI